MPLFNRSDLPDLAVFSAIMRTGSFKAAAIEIGVTSSALSHSLRRLEDRLGVKLLNRTTRSIFPTAAGLMLADGLESGFEAIECALGDIGREKERALAPLRLTVPRDAAELLIKPALKLFAARHPDMRLTIVVDNMPVDVVAQGFDAGIRFGDNVPVDMVAMALTPSLSWVVAGAPDYLVRHGRPAAPEDLLDHECIGVLLGNNSAFRWELGNGARMVSLAVPGRYVINDTQTTIDAAIDGLGLAYVLERRIAGEVEAGRLEIVLPEWRSEGAGYQIYYPSRRRNHPGLAPLVRIIRENNGWVKGLTTFPIGERDGADVFGIDG
jgi:DNA-binding transcriptional LysR family regulator